MSSQDDVVGRTREEEDGGLAGDPLAPALQVERPTPDVDLLRGPGHLVRGSELPEVSRVLPGLGSSPPSAHPHPRRAITTASEEDARWNRRLDGCIMVLRLGSRTQPGRHGPPSSGVAGGYDSADISDEVRERMAGILVVIPTYNERENLADTVARVRAAVPEASVLVVTTRRPTEPESSRTSCLGEPRCMCCIARRRTDSVPRTSTRSMGARAWIRPDRAARRRRIPPARAAAGPPRAARARGCRGGPRRPGHRVALDEGRLDRELAEASRAALAVGERLRAVDAAARHPATRRRGTGCFRADANPRRIRLEDVHTRGYGFQVEMPRHALEAGLNVVEVPVTFVERQRGESKMRPAIVIEAAARVTGWGLRLRFERRTTAQHTDGGSGSSAAGCSRA